MGLGDVHWVDSPGRGGHAQAGRRPGIILQGPRASAQLPTLLVVPLTTQQDALRFPGTTLIHPSADNGLTKPSVALVFQSVATDQRYVGARLGTISSDALSSIWAALDDLTERGAAP